MKRLSLQWRITLMSVLLIGITCVAMNLLLCSSGVYYMDTIADSLQGGGTVILNDGGAASFDPQLIAPNEELTIVVDGVQGRFRTTNWYITAAVTLLSGILAYFVSGRALKPLRSFTSQVEQVQLNNLADMRIDEDAISEFRQLSRSFNQMLERLNNAFSAQRQFTGNAAHELRTPLTSILAYARILNADDSLAPKTREAVGEIESNATLLLNMVNNILVISKHAAKKDELLPEPVDFVDLAQFVRKALVPIAEGKDVRLSCSVAPDVPLSMADWEKLRRILENLVNNAIKYTHRGGFVRLTIGFESGEEANHGHGNHPGTHVPDDEDAAPGGRGIGKMPQPAGSSCASPTTAWASRPKSWTKSSSCTSRPGSRPTAATGARG